MTTRPVSDNCREESLGEVGPVEHAGSCAEQTVVVDCDGTTLTVDCDPRDDVPWDEVP